VIDGGAIADTSVPFFAGIAPRAVLVAKDIAAPQTQAARDQLIAAGFADVVAIQGGMDETGSETVAA
jgi:hypothetical protein